MAPGLPFHPTGQAMLELSDALAVMAEVAVTATTSVPMQACFLASSVEPARDAGVVTVNNAVACGLETSNRTHEAVPATLYDHSAGSCHFDRVACLLPVTYAATPGAD